MAIEFVCPTCSGTLRVGDEAAGRVIRCGACQTTLRVPERANEPEPEPTELPDRGDKPPGSLEAEMEPPRAAEPVGPSPRARSRDWDDDPDDRPRRPRRRRPPPPPGRGVLFWLALIGGITLLLGCGCCGGMYLLIPGPEWRAHESAKGGFRVELPAAPRADMDKIAGDADPAAPIEGTILFGRLEEYAVVHRDIPADDRRWITDKQWIDETVKAMRSEPDVQSVLSEKDITVGGFTGREIEFAAGGGWYAARVVVADTRIYIVIGGGRFAKPGNANVRRFLDSFQVTDPKLKNPAQKKAGANRWREEE